MRKVVVFQHVPYEILGTLVPLLKTKKFRIQYINFGRNPEAQPSLEDCRALIVLGGPMYANDEKKHPHLKTEKRLIEEALKKEIPILGICLGAQLIAATLGAKVHRNSGREIGWKNVITTELGKQDIVLRGLGSEVPIFQWHLDCFDLPLGSTHLAFSEVCENQAFRWGKNVYGFQFHLEVDRGLIDRWLRTPSQLKQLKLPGMPTMETLRGDTDSLILDSEKRSEAVFSELVQIFGPIEKKIHLGSGHR